MWNTEWRPKESHLSTWVRGEFRGVRRESSSDSSLDFTRENHVHTYTTPRCRISVWICAVLSVTELYHNSQSCSAGERYRDGAISTREILRRHSSVADFVRTVSGYLGDITDLHTRHVDRIDGNDSCSRCRSASACSCFVMTPDYFKP
jgi:hypothetical protein